MREDNATRGILDRAMQQARGKGASRITDVYVAVGAISNYSEEPVRLCWGELSKGTIAEGARLHFRRIEAELQCMACFTRYRPEGEEIRCPQCGSSGAKVLAGEEFYMEALDVE
jgi:hydrogenase nickel incorporation protein HypA/HybF